METAIAHQIEAKELRIGNLLFRKSNNLPVNVIEIGVGGVNISWGNRYLHYDELQPIPITPEILESIQQSEVIEDTYYFEAASFSLSKANTAHDHYLVKLFGGHGLTSIKYLHQLQNLYFAVTGEELEIKL